MEKADVEVLLKRGNLGNYKFCKVDQIVIIKDDGVVINYFTHIDFSSKHTEEKGFSYLTKRPESVSHFRVAVSTYTISVDEFILIYEKAKNDGIWEYNNHIVRIDDAFVTPNKFIPIFMAISQYNCFVPFEYALYGTNYMANYYISELYSKKSLINKLVDVSTRTKIQAIIKSCGLNFRLDKLYDRIGNVVCKFNIESLESTAKRLGDENGIEYEFKYTDYILSHEILLHILQEHDGIIYENKVVDNFKEKCVEIPPNQYKTQISILDKTTGLTLFCGNYDYRSYSGNHSQITAKYFAAQSPDERILHYKAYDEKIKLINLVPRGELYNFIENGNANERKKVLDDQWLSKKGYIKSYNHNQHDYAIRDIVQIMNAKGMLWDLQEIWVIDPYLCSNDIIKTAVKCAKKGISIKALSAYQKIKSNSEVSKLVEASNFEEFKEKERDILNGVLGMDTDICLEYRTVYNGHGEQFHDRYIILKFDINKSRVWSLGASINAIGKTHSTIQIVEAPTQIISLFEELWLQTDCDECIIFNNVLKGE